MSAVRTRLERVMREGDDPALVLDARALEEAVELLIAAGDDDIAALRLVGLLHWVRHQHLDLEEDEDPVEREFALRYLRPVFSVEPATVPEALWAELAMSAPPAGDTPPAWAEEAVRLLSEPRLAALPEVLTRAVALLELAVRHHVPADPNLTGYLSALGSALLLRYQRVGLPDDLDQAVEFHQRALDAIAPDDPERIVMVSNLSASMQIRYDRNGAPADLDRAVELAREAVEATTPGDPHYAGYRFNLGLSLSVRFQLTGSLDDLLDAVSMKQQALASVSPDDSDRPSYQSSLALVLHARYQRLGSPADLDEAIDLGRQAVAGTPPGHREYASYLNTLGNILRSRGERTGSLTDLDEAVSLGFRAVETTTPEEPFHVAYLSNLSAAFQQRYRRTGEIQDLERSIQLGERAVEIVGPEYPHRALLLSNLGNARQAHYDVRGDPESLDAAIAVTRQAIEITPTSHPRRASYLTNLGTKLSERFRRSGAPTDLDMATAASREAAQAVPADHPDYGMYRFNLGRVLRTRLTALGEDEAGHEAISMFRHSAQSETATPLVRARSAEAWAQLAADRADWPDSAHAWDTLFDQLPLLTDHSLDRSDRQHHLSLLTSVGSSAAVTALELGDPTRSWQLLEQGRGVLLGQALQIRADFSRLAESHPELAEDLRILRQRLDMAVTDAVDPGAVQLPPGAAADARREAAAALQDLLRIIRAQEGFARFGLPPTLADLQSAVGDGTAVAVNVTRHRCDALILRRDGVAQLPLPDLTQADAIIRVPAFLEKTSTFTADTADIVADILAWLWDTVAAPILDHLGHTVPPAADDAWPRIWWIPTGLMSLLPVHAAGRPDGPGVVDLVVSSYTPTVQALHHTRARRSRPELHPLIVGINQAHMARHRPLTFARTEATHTSEALGGTVAPLLDDQATYDTVVRSLPGTTVAHFACHGAVAPDPADSHLVLYDRALPVSDLIDLDLDGAYLAYLSACATAFGGVRLLDESIHLASAFHLAGFQHVIGTLWPIADAVAPELSRHVYEQLAQDVPPAIALHRAIRLIREDYPDHPQLWAAHIHIGTAPLLSEAPRIGAVSARPANNDGAAAYQRHARAVGHMLHDALQWHLDPPGTRWLDSVLSLIEAAADHRDPAAMRSARGSLASLSSRQLGGIGDPPTEPAPELPHDRINHLIHRLIEEEGPAGLDDDPPASAQATRS